MNSYDYIELAQDNSQHGFTTSTTTHNALVSSGGGGGGGGGGVIIKSADLDEEEYVEHSDIDWGVGRVTFRNNTIINTNEKNLQKSIKITNFKINYNNNNNTKEYLNKFYISSLKKETSTSASSSASSSMPSSSSLASSKKMMTSSSLSATKLTVISPPITNEIIAKTIDSKYLEEGIKLNTKSENHIQQQQHFIVGGNDVNLSDTDSFSFSFISALLGLHKK